MGSTSFLYCGKAVSFTWKDHCFKLHLPENALPPDVTECSIRVSAALSGQFQFPDDAELVSGIYSIHSSHSFTRSVTVEIEHFSTTDTLEEAEELSFVVSTGDRIPHQFNPLKHGVFSVQSKYGSIEVKHFCKNGIVRRKKEKRSENRKQTEEKISYSKSRNLYKGYLLHDATSPNNDWGILFSIIQDSAIHSKVRFLIILLSTGMRIIPFAISESSY